MPRRIREPLVLIRAMVPKTLRDRIDRKGEEFARSMPWMGGMGRSDVIRILLYQAIGMEGKGHGKKG